MIMSKRSLHCICGFNNCLAFQYADRLLLWLNAFTVRNAWIFLFVILCAVFKAVHPDRSCQVAVAAEKIYLSPVLSNDASTDVACGSEDRPWQLEAPSGQRINISLLDFSAGSSSSSSSVQRARTVETASSSRCVRQFGFIDDKSANRHIDICSDDAHRLQTLYVSHTNEVAIVLHNTQHNTGNFLVAVKG